MEQFGNSYGKGSNGTCLVSPRGARCEVSERDMCKRKVAKMGVRLWEMVVY